MELSALIVFFFFCFYFCLFKDEKAFGKYLKATETMDPALRAEYLKTDSSITSAHHDSATSGQSEVYI